MTNAEFAILTLIAEQPRHGYEIEHLIEERGMREWTELAFSTIYYILKKLEAAGWVVSRLEASEGKGAARRVFSITVAGRKALRQATLQALSEPQPCFQPLQLGLANQLSLPPAEAQQALQQYHQRLTERREQVAQKRAAQAPFLPAPVQAMFDLSLTLIQAELDWVERYLERLKAPPTIQAEDSHE